MKRVLIDILRPRLGLMALASLLVTLASLVTLVIPWVLGQIVGDLLDPATTIPPLLMLAAFASILVQSLLSLGSTLVSLRIATDVVAELRKRTFGHALCLPLGFHEGHKRGDAIALLGRDVDFLGQFSANFATGTVPMLVTLVGAAVMMLRIDPLLAAPILLAIPVAIVAFRLLARRLRPLGVALRRQEAAVVSTVEEAMAMLPTIKRFAREPVEIARHREEVARARVLALRLDRTHALLQPAIQVLAAAAVIAMLLLLQVRLDGLALTTAEWTSLLLYAGLIVRPLSGLAGAWGQIQVARGTMARLDEVLAQAPEAVGPDRGERPPGGGEILFRNVSYAYRPGRWALRELSLKIRAGEHVALVGPNGCGKSTLVRLVSGLDAPTEGEVLVNGRATTAQDLASLRRSVSVVPQQVQLLDATVRENIAFGAIDATDEEVVEAAKSALADGFISGLELGYDTVVGEDGVWLSGGQRQRIALARALIGDPAILILDEPTAMFDIDGERAFFDAAAGLFEKRTVILIAHTDRVFDIVDRVVTLRGGRLETDSRDRRD